MTVTINMPASYVDVSKEEMEYDGGDSISFGTGLAIMLLCAYGVAEKFRHTVQKNDVTAKDLYDLISFAAGLPWK